MAGVYFWAYARRRTPTLFVAICQNGLYIQLHGVILISIFPAWPASQGMAGVYYFGPMPSTRVVVFIDYQNVYHCARELFSGPGWTPPSTGNVYPLEYGKMLCDLGLEKDPNRVLAGVRVYRGQPVHGKGHEKVCRSFDRQVALWEKTQVWRCLPAPSGTTQL